MTKIQSNAIGLFHHFGHSNFESVSDFDIRISDFFNFKNLWGKGAFLISPQEASEEKA
jgi:hypothetical protein